ncbi:MAG: UpxY family transcription antiterminator [Paludibacter sp.]|nr:UpxY family transcription antiterminator [Paludibacter sp.]
MSNQDELRWYAVYTAPRAEKKVSERFAGLAIEHYLPLQKIKRRWSDRIKEVQIPIISGYIFVRVSEREFEKVTKVYGALSFIREGGNPVAIPGDQINALQLMIESADEEIEYSTETIEKGESVIIVKGPLQGLIGELIDSKGNYKVLVRLEKLGCALTTVPLSFVQRLE